MVLSKCELLPSFLSTTHLKPNVAFSPLLQAPAMPAVQVAQSCLDSHFSHHNPSRGLRHVRREPVHQPPISCLPSQPSQPWEHPSRTELTACAFLSGYTFHCFPTTPRVSQSIPYIPADAEAAGTCCGLGSTGPVPFLSAFCPGKCGGRLFTFQGGGSLPCAYDSPQTFFLMFLNVWYQYPKCTEFKRSKMC